jgi:hypothetical protein
MLAMREISRFSGRFCLQGDICRTYADLHTESVSGNK